MASSSHALAPACETVMDRQEGSAPSRWTEPWFTVGPLELLSLRDKVSERTVLPQATIIYDFTRFSERLMASLIVSEVNKRSSIAHVLPGPYKAPVLTVLLGTIAGPSV